MAASFPGRRKRQRPPLARRAVFVVLAVGALGAVFSLDPGTELAGTVREMVASIPTAGTGEAAPQRAPEAPGGALARAPRDEFDRLFREGLKMMQTGRAHDALVTFEMARTLRPHVPELLVNMGYVQVSLDAAEEARVLFDRALRLRADQLNAYYGLATALDALGDRAGAVGAMRTYVHLAPQDDPFVIRAQSALWEWDFEARHAPGTMQKIMEVPGLVVPPPQEDRVDDGERP